MEIIRARHSGFCYGVKRAVKMVEEKAKEGEIFTWGPLIHNPPMIEKLKEKGIIPLNNKENAQGKRMVIPAHGIPPEELKSLRSKAKEIIDATCPFVKRVHQVAKEIQREGYFLIILGEKEHPEIKGLTALLQPPFLIIKEEEELPSSLPPRVGVVCQTTMDYGRFFSLTSLLLPRIKELKIVNTICQATLLRQKALKEILPFVDLVIVVGGHNSANTRRLWEIAQSSGKPSYLVERKEEIVPFWFKGVKKIGITAGASTPEWLIEEVQTHILKISP